MFKVEMSTDTFKQVIEGSKLLAAKYNFDRIKSGKPPITVTEDYFLRQAVFSYLESLRNELKSENFNY